MTAWTPDRVEALKARFQAGDSFAMIARALGGVSRSACIGKATRLGLARSRDHGEFHRVAAKVATARAQRPVESPRRVAGLNSGAGLEGPKIWPAGLRALAAFEGEGRVAMADVETVHCRWPFGDPETGTFRFCGERRRKGAYCATHAGQAYLPVPDDQGAEWLERVFGWLS